MKFFLPIFIFVAFSASAQTNLVAPTNRLDAVSNMPAQTVSTDTNQGLALAQRVEDMRAVCIQNRRMICGKILKVLPDGLVVDSGYTNLMRAPLNQSWLIPGTVAAARATHLVEEKNPDAICIGLVFLTDLPKSPGAKPQVFDYVNLEGFPMGQYTYASVGDLKRTVRRFTTKGVHLDTVLQPDARTPSPREERVGRGSGRGVIEPKPHGEQRASSPRPSPPSDGGEGVNSRTVSRCTPTKVANSVRWNFDESVNSSPQAK